VCPSTTTAWATDLAHRVDTYGPPPLARMTRQFLDLNDYDIKTRITPNRASRA
jgi:hypothetical protein